MTILVSSTTSPVRGKMNSQLLCFFLENFYTGSSCSLENYQSDKGFCILAYNFEILDNRNLSFNSQKAPNSSMSKVKPRKYKMVDWIQEETVFYRNGRTYGYCKFCQVIVRGSVWDKHPKKCAVLKQKVYATQKQVNKKVDKMADFLVVKEQIIKAVTNTMTMLIPKYLQQVYHGGISFQNMSRMVGRVYSSCKKFVEEICCQSSFDNLALEEIQAIVPPNYHVNITCIIKNVEDLENYMLIRHNILEMKASSSTKLKYIKAFNLLARHYNLGWQISQQEDKDQVKTIRRQPLLQANESQFKTKKKVLQPEISSPDSFMSQQSPEDKLDIVQQQAELSQLSQKSKAPLRTDSLERVEKVFNIKCEKFSNIIQEMQKDFENGEKVNKQLATILKKRAHFINFNILQDCLKKCQLCKIWINGESFMKCTRCCSCYCNQCFEIDHSICNCIQDNNKQLPSPCSPLKMLLSDSLLAKSKLNVYCSQNRMTKLEITGFEKTLSSLLQSQYGVKFVRTSVFYQFQFLRSYNCLYDPSIQRASKSIQKIYAQYEMGTYLPKIKIAKSHKGYGVYSKQLISQRSFLFQYSGDILPCRISKGRGDKTMKYLSGPTSHHQMQITTFKHCGIGPLVNHSSKPNAKTIKILINQTPRIIFYSIRDIAQDQQICYNYNGFSNQYPVQFFEDEEMTPFDLQVQQVSKVPVKINSVFPNKLYQYCKTIDKPHFIILHSKEVFHKKLDQKIIEIASITKLITVLTCYYMFDVCDVDESTIIEVPSLKLFENETKAGLRKGQKLTIEQLFQCIFICSAGDAAETLAQFFFKKFFQQTKRTLSFVDQMKQTMSNIGMKSTSIQDCRGVKQNFSTIEDMTILISCLYKNLVLRKYFQLKTTRIQTKLGGKANKLILTPTNQLQNQLLYGKTGKTRDGKACFLGYKQYEDQILFLGIFDCLEAERWIIAKKILQIYEKNLE